MKGRFLSAAVIILSFPLLGRAQTLWPTARLLPALSNLTRPVDIGGARDASGVLYVVEQAGRILAIRDGQRLDPPFLDIRARVGSSGNEQGLLGLAFPPGYAGKRYFYVNYTDLAGHTIIARFHANPDTLRADAASEQVLLRIEQPFSNHNGGQLAFGPRDGYLYIATGDGGSGGDPRNNGQSRSTLLGKILRIDTESGQSPYAIPPGNPFVGVPGARPEIWAYGLRNPWRISFDRETGDLYIADVGQNTREEVNFQPASSAGGENYGWNVMEGRNCFRPACNPAGYVFPIHDYPNDGVTTGCSVTGGFVYRGRRYPALTGIYFFSDFCSGKIWGLRRDGGVWQHRLLLDDGAPISSFGEDDDGNLYVADFRGRVREVASGAPAFPSAGVTNAASFESGIVAGSIASIFGLAITPGPGLVEAMALPLPSSLAGVRVTVGGHPAPLFHVISLDGREQLNLQIPWEIAGAPNAPVIVEVNGLASAAAQVEVLPAQPGLFALPNGDAAALDAGNALVSAQHPARRGEIVNLFLTGLGAVNRVLPSGEGPPDGVLVETLSTPSVSVGGVAAEVLFSGLAPGFAGLYQVQIRLGAKTPPGLQPVTVTMLGRTTLPVRLAIE